jgi:hypothetical protein
MKVSGQLHAPAALGNIPRYALDMRLGGIRAVWGHCTTFFVTVEKGTLIHRSSTEHLTHYTDCYRAAFRLMNLTELGLAWFVCKFQKYYVKERKYFSKMSPGIYRSAIASVDKYRFFFHTECGNSGFLRNIYTNLTRLHGLTSQQTVIIIFTTVRPSKHTVRKL